MGSATLPLPSGIQRAINPWFVGVAVVIPTLMGAVGTTIVGVARPYIAGGLSAPAADDEWVMTSYLAAHAFILAGHRLAVGPLRPPQLLPLVDCRLHHCLGAVRHGHQSAAADPVPGNPGTGRRRVPALEPGDPAGQPSRSRSRAPPRRCSCIALLVGPIVGPVLGGWLVVNYSWRWIFYINVPVGLVSFLACYALLEDPDHLRQERAELKKRPLNFDGIGLGLLALVIASWEVMLSKGEEWDWLGDSFWRVQTLLIVFVLALAGLLYRELTFASPVVNFRVLRERNFAVSCGITFGAFVVLYAASVALPLMLLTSFGYDAYAAGRVLWPAGVFSPVDAAGRGPPPRLGHRRTLANRLGPAHHGGGQLLDGADELVHQSVAGDLAAGRDDHRPVADVRSAQRGRLPLHRPSTCAGRPWACSPCSATKAAVSACRWSRPSRSGAISSTPHERASSSTPSIRKRLPS